MKVPQTVDVELTLSATVTITQEVLDGIQDQYEDLYEQGKEDPEMIARAMVYASVNPRIPYSNEHHEDIWDGVCDLKGLIQNLELEG